jgi:hypothetical protein
MIRGNFREGNTFVIIENDHNRVTGDGTGMLFEQVNVWEREPGGPWTELFVWDCAEWREPWTAAFEAILGVIAKVAAGLPIEAIGGSGGDDDEDEAPEVPEDPDRRADCVDLN